MLYSLIWDKTTVLGSEYFERRLEKGGVYSYYHNSREEPLGQNALFVYGFAIQATTVSLWWIQFLGVNSARNLAHHYRFLFSPFPVCCSIWKAKNNEFVLAFNFWNKTSLACCKRRPHFQLQWSLFASSICKERSALSGIFENIGAQKQNLLLF